jgi:F-type H+-transporting ATPase subunit g
VTYNLSVAKEVIKQVYAAELVPPSSFGQVQEVYAAIWKKVSQRAYWQQVAQSGEWARLSIYGLQAYGLFKASVSRGPPCICCCCC